MARPDKTKKHSDLGDMSLTVPADPATNTMTQENKNTTTVLTAVATSESVFLIPHFARTDVTPAKNADNTAIIIHITLSPSHSVRIIAHGIKSRNNVFLFRYYTIFMYASAHMESKVETTTFCFDIIA